MPRPIAYKTGTIQPPNTAKQNNVLVGVGGSNWGAGSANTNFYNSLDSSYQYVIIKNSAVPAMWGTGDFTDSGLLTVINGLPDRVGQTRFTNVTTAVSWSVASGQYSILKSEEVYPAPVVDGLVTSFNPKSVNRWPNGNNSVSSSFGGARYPLYMRQESTTTVVDISNDKPYVGSPSNYALKFSGSEVYDWAGIGTKMGLEVGKTYTFSFWLKSLSSTTTNMYVNQQGGSGDSTTLTAVSPNGTFINPTTTWQRSSWTFTLNADKYYLFFGRSNNGNLQPGVGILVTEMQMEEGNTPTTFKNFTNFDLPTNGGLSTGSWSLNNMTGYQAWAWDGSNGGCYPFDGVDDFIRLSVTPPITTALTYTAWVYTNAFSSNNAVFNIRGTLFELNSGGLGYWSDVFQGSTGASYSFTTGSWNFIAVTQNNTAVTLYINGSQINTATQPSINMGYGSFDSNYLGTYGGGGRFLNGKIGNAQIYNRALSATEIENLYNADVSTYLPTSSIVNQGLTVYYDFSNPNSYPGSGTTVYDLSGYDNNGTLINSPTFSTDNGGALVFDGVDDYVQFTSTYAGTICFWGIMDANISENGALVGVTATGDGALRQGSLSFRGIAGPPFNWNGGDSNDYQFGYPNQFMINGTSSLSTTNGYYVVPNSRTLTQNFYIGAIGNRNVSTLSHTFMGRTYKGKIFKVMIYNRQLTNTELQQNFNAFKSQFGL